MEKKVKEIIGKIKGDAGLAETLPDNAHIIHDIGLDSLQLINFVLQVEEDFQLEFDFDGFDYCHLASITTFCRFLVQQVRPDAAHRDRDENRSRAASPMH